MNCDVGSCANPADVLIKFKNVDKSYPYCNSHAFDRRGKPVFKTRTMEGGQYVVRDAVRHIQRIPGGNK